jgi:NAD(P)-dependent dehydrogenase (short-subunit alcohol dehydrogenase family)
MNPEIAQMMSLEEKVAIVTGGAMGIGQGIALRLAQAGASVVIADVNEESGNRTAEKIRVKSRISHLDMREWWHGDIKAMPTMWQ